jgi:hypothetical protein
LEDQKLLANFIPLLIDVIPKAAAEIEADTSVHSNQGFCLLFSCKLQILLLFPQATLILFKLLTYNRRSCTYELGEHIFWVNEEKYILELSWILINIILLSTLAIKDLK